MIYLIANKYYIKVAPMRYTEIDFFIKNNDVVIQPTKNRIESNSGTKIQEIDFKKEKEKIKRNLLKKDDDNNSDYNGVVTTKHRKRR